MTPRSGSWSEVSRSFAVRVPAAVAMLMIAISALVTFWALSRLEETQQRHLEQLSSAYLDGLSASLIPSVVREDVWEVFDTLDRSRKQYKGLNVRWVTVTNAQGKTIASSAPAQFPPLAAMPPDAVAMFQGKSEVLVDEKSSQARMTRSLIYQDQDIGRIYAVADVSELIAERRHVLWELLVTNALLTLLLVGFGAVLMRWLLRPVGLLSGQMARGREERMPPIPEKVVSSQSREFRDLFRQYNEMAAAVNEREVLAAELAEEEKLASVGRLASGMAHEINNPLGGMFNALDSLKRYGTREEVRTTSIRLIEHGLSGIRDLVRSTLTTYRADARPRDLTPTDLDDRRLLVKPEARQRRLKLAWQIDFDRPIQVPAVPVRDAILNLLINACHACQEGGTVGFHAEVAAGKLVAEVTDTGEGLRPHVREYLERKGAGVAPMDRRSGLGLWIVKRHCDELNAELIVVEAGLSGTKLRLVIPVRSVLENVA